MKPWAKAVGMESKWSFVTYPGEHAHGSSNGGRRLLEFKTKLDVPQGQDLSEMDSD
jgi:hypothetical protein